MNDFLSHAKKLLGALIGHPWGSTASHVTLAVAALVLLFGAGTLARVIFAKDTGLFRTAGATLLVIIAALAACAGALCAGAGATTAYAVAGAVALAAVWPAGKILGVPYGPAFGIMTFALALTLGAAYGAGRTCSAIADGAGKLDSGAVGHLAK